MSLSIVIVEDDAQLAQIMAEFLSGEGYATTIIDNGTDAVNVIPEQQPDLVLLDVMLPGIDGVEVCRKVRQAFSNPIIMLTASDNEYAEIAALNLGADSYLNKPIKPQVLLAHIQAVLRREPVGQTSTSEPNILKVQDVTLNLASREARIGESQIDLTSGEFEVLWYLMENAGQNVSRDDLYIKIRGMEYDGFDRSIDLRISHIRKKMDDEKAPYKYLKTIRNKGYQFAV